MGNSVQSVGFQTRSCCSMAINKVAVAILVIVCSASIGFGADDHVVGGSQGWGFSVTYADWAKGNSFVAGDNLVFNYQSGVHNVVPVSAAGYRSCKATGTAAATSGNDKFALKKGANYFICGIPGHCSAGMKIAVIAG